MKHLPKHLRPRWRYLAVELEAWPDADVSRDDFQRSLWFAAQNLLGDVGSADADLRVVDFSFADGAGEVIVRVRRGEVERGRAALACVSAVRDDPVRVSVRGVSGTMRAAEEKYLGRTAEVSADERVAFGGDSRPAFARGDRVDVDVEGSFVGATRLDCE
ncbi:Rpp14/Pop5 family protein [Halobacterium litoreum]|uniref:Ribonuclease P protein component 2 n=1 Tax=Halobacterium litoreum TaxID=2039234 RepID=A0ABD5NBX8_9EURY|nr:Rpp14/Pop5 family protein [Halobacterium litoreum]UHH14479.1 ribonuclease P [Halobacterium litoreum]